MNRFSPTARIRSASKDVKRFTHGLVCAVMVLLATSCYAKQDIGNQDFIYNWDVTSTLGGSSRRDWPVNLVFYGPGATEQNVNGILAVLGYDWSSPSAMYLYVQDYPHAAHWASDGGRKNPSIHKCDGWTVDTGGTHRHARIYSNESTGYIANLGFSGKLVVATSHWDYKEGCGNEEFGYSEHAEQIFADLLDDYFIVYPDYVNLNNPANGVRGTKHIEDSNGYATAVYMPAF